MTQETELPAVKALEWTAVGKRFDAHTFFGIYSVCDLGNYVHLRLHPGMEGAHVGEAYHSETLDKAKAAAQADYERRILSALVPSTPAESRCEELVKALEGKWRPIETAPKDGTKILLCGGVYHGAPFPGYWEPSPYAPDRPWMTVIGRSSLYEHVPTHWMPLPAAPLSSSRNRSEADE